MVIIPLVVGQLFGAAENLEIGIGTVAFVPNFVPFLYQFCTSLLQKVVVVKKQFSGTRVLTKIISSAFTIVLLHVLLSNNA